MSKQEEVLNYLSNVINPVLKPMVSQIVLQRPQNIMKFVFQYAKKVIEQCQQKSKKINISNQTIQSQESKTDLEQIQRKFNEKKKKRNQSQSISFRKGISAQVFGQFNKKPIFVPKVYPKKSQQISFLRKHLLKSFIFHNLSQQNLKIVMQAMQSQQFKPEMQIIKEGDNGDMLYIIRSGQYKCTKMIDNKPKCLRMYKQGQIFGQLSLMYNTKRAASIKCIKQGMAYALDRSTFNNIVQQEAIKTRQEYMKILNKIEIISEVDKTEKDILCDALRQQRFEPNQYIVNQGENGDKLYFIMEGNLIAEKLNGKNNKKEVVFKYKEHQYFGEIALVKNTPRQASVKAVTKCRLLSIGREQFKRLLGPIEKILQRNIQKYKKFVMSS